MLAVLVSSVPACIPTEPEPLKAAQPASPPQAEAAEASKTKPGSETPKPATRPAPPLVNPVTQSSQDGVSQMQMDMAGSVGVNVEVAVTPMEGAAGFSISGSYGLEGNIARPDPNAERWQLTGSFTFPTSGFAVGKPLVIPIQTMLLAPGKARLEGGTNEFLIQIPVSLPQTQAGLSQEEVNVPVATTIFADKDAKFTVTLADG